MPTYIGQPCSSCRSILTKTDDIVVCPECGSPYHRECYKIEGKCVNTILHENNESWKPEITEPEVEQKSAEKIVFCRNCGTENSSESPFCKNCGCPVNLEKAAGSLYERVKGEKNAAAGSKTSSQDFSGFGGMIGFVPITKEQDIDGNTAGDYAEYVGEKSSMYYIPKFLRFSKGSKVSFNFCAFFLTHFYFFYRKMISFGIVLLVAQTVLSLPSSLYVIAESGYMNYLPVMNEAWFMNMANVFSTLSYILSILAGLFANYLYYKKAKDDLNSIKSIATDDDGKKAAIASKGGTSWKYVLAGALGATVLSYASLIVLFSFLGLSL